MFFPHLCEFFHQGLRGVNHLGVSENWLAHIPMDHPHFSWQTPLLDNIWDCLKVVMSQALYFSIIKESVGAGAPLFGDIYLFWTWLATWRHRHGLLPQRPVRRALWLLDLGLWGSRVWNGIIRVRFRQCMRLQSQELLKKNVKATQDGSVAWIEWPPFSLMCFLSF